MSSGRSVSVFRTLPSATPGLRLPQVRNVLLRFRQYKPETIVPLFACENRPCPKLGSGHTQHNRNSTQELCLPTAARIDAAALLTTDAIAAAGGGENAFAGAIH